MNNQSWISRKTLAAAAITLILTLTGCAQHTPPTQTCPNSNAMAQTTLYFGMSRTDGPNMTQAQWQNYVNKQVTPRFKNGLTVFKGRGQWLGADGKIAKEPSRALMLIYPKGDQTSQQKIEQLRKIYMQQFHQESVMRIDQKVCVSF